MAKQGLNPRFNAQREIPTFEEVAQQVHIDRMPTWKNQKHGQQWINTLRDYAFPKIGRMPIDSIDQPEVMMCLAPIWTEKHETAKRLAQRLKIVLDVAKSKGFRSGENPVTSIKDAQALPKPEIFNTDQGSQFTSGVWIDVLTDAKIKISMPLVTLLRNALPVIDGKGAWRDNRMIERLWRSLKYECVYLNAFETGSEMRTGIRKWLIYYNSERPHLTHGILTPDEAYVSKTVPMRLAA